MKKRSKQEFQTMTNNDIANSVLYEMCIQYPLISDVSQLSAKSFLIGRSYAASPQRGVKNLSKGMNYNFFDIYANGVINVLNSNKIKNFDIELNNLKNISISSIQDLYLAIRLVILFNDASFKTVNKNTISFTSKLLHFHAKELFFIIDSYASKNAKVAYTNKKIVDQGYKTIKGDLIIEGIYNTKYNDLIKHCIRCFYIKDNAGLNGYILTPRDVDNYLIKEMYL